MAAVSKVVSNTSALIRDLVLAQEITRVVAVTDIEIDLDRVDLLVNPPVVHLVVRPVTLVILVIGAATLGTTSGVLGGRTMARRNGSSATVQIEIILSTKLCKHPNVKMSNVTHVKVLGTTSEIVQTTAAVDSLKRTGYVWACQLRHMAAGLKIFLIFSF